MDIERKDFENNNLYQSCLCSRPSDKRLLKFLCQFFICLVTMSFCIFKLADPTIDCEAQSVYIGIFTSVIGLWLPTPTITK
jgi:hypothetical protein